MKRTRFGRRSGLSRDAEELVWLSTGLAESGSRPEDRYWEQRLAQLTDAVLDADDEDIFNESLEHLQTANSRAYDELADFVESRAETAQRDDDSHDVLLIAAPILAWSRFRIPATSVPAAVLSNLRVHLQAHVLADNVGLAVADHLFSPDQLPVGYCGTARFAEEVGAAALDGSDIHVSTDGMPETPQFLSDARYLLAAVAVPRGGAVFRWQEKGGNRKHALEQWRAQGGACLAPLFPGSAIEVVLPETYFAACRQADRESRPYSVRASVAFLSTTLETPASALRAIIAPFQEHQLEEYRIGFTRSGSSEVVHGVVWPLLGGEDDDPETVSQIEAVLRESGLSDIVVLDNAFPIEYCDDCGAPYYPSAEGEAVHAELPEEPTDRMPRHLH